MKKRQAGIIGAAGAAVILCGILLKFILKFRREKALSISVIGGSDGPTSIFLAGKVGGGFFAVLVAFGLLLILLAGLALIYFIRKKK